jgi:extracellular solute-binding protein (family 7)
VDWFFAGNGRRLYQEMYDQARLNVRVIPFAFGGAEASGWFAKEILKPDDIKGLRMRSFGLAGRVMTHLGASTVLVPGGMLGYAFDKHQIDAAEFLTPAVDQRQRLQHHVKLIYMPGWHQPETVLEFLINHDRWNALDDQQQTVLETACRATLLATLAESPRLQAAALEELPKDGVCVETWSDEMMKAFRRAWDEVAKEEGDRDEFSERCGRTLRNSRRATKARIPHLHRRRLEREGSTRGRLIGREWVRYAKSPLLRIGLQIGDDVGSLIGIRNSLERQSHRGIRNHRLGIGDPLVDIFFRPNPAGVSELLHSGGIHGVVGDARRLAPDSAVQFGSHERLGARAYLMADAAFGEGCLALLGVTSSKSRST